MSNNNGIKIEVIGDSGPFSRLGKSIGYRLTFGSEQFLLDCGAPVFQLLGPEGLSDITGVLGTHAHEDHKRWFTDIALYQKFSAPSDEKVKLLGSHEIINDFKRASAAALERTLSEDSSRVVNIPFEDYIESTCISPKPKYKCKRVSPSGFDGMAWRVVDNDNAVLPPDRAKVVTRPDISQPRMLFKDPEDDIWVEPQTYYSYDDERFYESESQTLDTEIDLSITPIKASAWHGPPTTSLKFQYGEEKLFFSSDTVHDPDLWNNLTKPVEPEHNIESSKWSDSYTIEGNINDFVQQIWSERRHERALEPYETKEVMIHDVSGPWAVVHTNYKYIESLENPMLLTHSPDEFTTLHPLAHLGKSFVIKNNELLEETSNEDSFHCVAECYHKRFNEYLVGFEDPDGDFFLVRLQSGHYDVIPKGDPIPDEVDIKSSIALYEDIGGEYFPYLPNEDEEYVIRPDGQIEHQTHHTDGTDGTIVEGRRAELSAHT